MIRFEQVQTAPLPDDERRCARTLELSWDDRTRSRLAIMSAGGEAIAIQLPRGTVLRDGAILRATDGSHAIVAAAPQRLHRIRAAPALLLKVVYHLANRHVAAELRADHVLIEADPVLAALARQLGAETDEVDAPFEPEAGAYTGGHGHGHGHRHADPADSASATLGEQLSIEAHQRRSGA